SAEGRRTIQRLIRKIRAADRASAAVLAGSRMSAAPSWPTGLVKEHRIFDGKGEGYDGRRTEPTELKEILTRIAQGEFLFNILIEGDRVLFGYTPDKDKQHEDMMPYEQGVLRGSIGYLESKKTLCVDIYPLKEAYLKTSFKDIGESLVRAARWMVENGFPASFPLMYDYRSSGYFSQPLTTIGEMAAEPISTDQEALTVSAAPDRVEGAGSARAGVARADSIVYLGDVVLRPSVAGQKAFMLSRAFNAGVAQVPSGYVLTTDYPSDATSQQIAEDILAYKARTYSTPIRGVPEGLLAVRSSAPESNPGLMKSVLFVGMTPARLKELEARVGEAQAYGGYYRFLRSFGTNVFDIPDEQFVGVLASETDAKVIARRFEKIIEEAGYVIPDESEQLAMAVRTVQQSARSQQVADYRKRLGLTQPPEAAVLVNPMRWTLGPDEGFGVFQSHPDRGIEVQFLQRASGDELSQPLRSKEVLTTETLRVQRPQLFARLELINKALREGFPFPFRVEFTLGTAMWGFGADRPDQLDVVDIVPDTSAVRSWFLSEFLEYGSGQSGGNLAAMAPFLAFSGALAMPFKLRIFRYAEAKNKPENKIQGGTGDLVSSGVAAGVLRKLSDVGSKESVKDSIWMVNAQT
ncbi:MAG: hypothetical protein WCG06_05565, partial [Candidatus Omnitrophota bacterium]